jgi:glycosyltransferase involved in cell wall biosynthesis
VLSVVVPAYQEADTVEESLHHLFDVLDELGLPVEVIVVSDGNTDGTDEAAARVARPGLRVLHYPENRGKGFALRHGFEHSSGDPVVFIDADRDIHPEAILRFLTMLDQQDVDAVIASKTHPESVINYPAARRFQSRVFRVIVRRFFRLNVSDTQTGLKVFRRKVLEACVPYVRTSGFSFDLELLVLANDAGFSVVEGPFQLDFQFSTTTGARAVIQVLKETLHLALRRLRGRRRGDWIGPRRLAEQADSL